jgi:hypothetical protein
VAAADVTVDQLDLVDSQRLRDSVMQVITVGRSQDRQAVIDAILDNVAPGGRFSANTIRQFLPPTVAKHVIGPTFGELKKAGVIIPCGSVLSSDRRTRADIGLYYLAHPDRVPTAGVITVRPEGRGEGLRWVASWPDTHTPGKRMRLDAGTREALDPFLAVIARTTGYRIVAQELQ